MRQALKLHPESRCSAVSRIEAEAARLHPGALVLRYVVSGTINGLRLPPVTARERRDELWRHTCFEAFLRAGSDAYYEFNFAPSMCWAAYAFEDYRTGMGPVENIAAPDIEIRCGGACIELSAVLELDRLSLPPDAAWRLGLSAVIEEKDGSKSYWALAHPPGRPDFHHSDCFAHELAPA